MPSILQTVRGKVPSKRALLAVGGAAAVLVGAIQTTDTLAAENDAVNANTSQIASQNFFPVLAPVNPGYSTPGTCFGGNASLKWQAASGTPSNQQWQIEEWGNGGTTLMWTSGLLASSMRERQTGMEGGGGSTHEYRIYGVNATTSERSTGYVSVYFYRDGGRCNYSKGTAAEGPVNISTWQQTTDFQPFDAEEVTNLRTFSARNFEAPVDLEDSELETSAPSSTTESKPSPAEEAEAPSTSTEPTETTSTPSTSTEPTETTSAPSTSPSEEAEAGKITIAIEAQGTARRMLVQVDGVRKCSVPLDEGDTPTVGDGKVSITNGNTVKEIDPDNCSNED